MALQKRNKIEKPFTEVELELMNAVWTLEECTVKEVQENLPKDRDLAYTSVATVMKILEQKRALKSEKKEKAHVYRPLISRADYEALSLQHLTANLFGGDPASMVMRLIGDTDMSSQEMKAIRSLIEERLNDK